MRHVMFLCLIVFGLSLGGFSFLPYSSAVDQDEGFQDLFNGKDFTGWKMFLPSDADPNNTWSVKDGENGHGTSGRYGKIPFSGPSASSGGV